MRPMAARGEVRVVVSFGLTSSPVLSHAVSYAIEHASATEELGSIRRAEVNDLPQWGQPRESTGLSSASMFLFSANGGRSEADARGSLVDAVMPRRR